MSRLSTSPLDAAEKKYLAEVTCSHVKCSNVCLSATKKSKEEAKKAVLKKYNKHHAKHLKKARG